MKHRVLVTFSILFGVLLISKWMVDTCLPYQESNLLQFLFRPPEQVCKIWNDWDYSARLHQHIIAAQADGNERAIRTVDTEQFAMTDIMQLNELMNIFPVLLTLFPLRLAATKKVLLLIFSSGFLILLLLHYMAEAKRIVRAWRSQNSEEEIRRNLRRR